MTLNCFPEASTTPGSFGRLVETPVALRVGIGGQLFPTYIQRDRGVGQRLAGGVDERACGRGGRRRERKQERVVNGVPVDENVGRSGVAEGGSANAQCC